MSRYLPDDNLIYPVLIKIGNGTGSGFYFRNAKKLFLITARHVLFDVNNSEEPLRDNTVELLSYDKDTNIKTPIKLKVDLLSADVRKNSAKDIAILELGTTKKDGAVEFSKSVTKTRTSNKSSLVVVPQELLKKFDDVMVSNEVFILGYPNSLSDPELQQIQEDTPLLRKGIVAGLNHKNKTIILDCPVYFGNSGGLAIEVEETGLGEKLFRVIGVVSEFIPFIEKLRSMQLGYTNLRYENSGYAVAVPIDTIIELTEDKPLSKAAKSS